MKTLLTLACMLLSISVFADDHSLTTIIGTGIELKTADHAIAGSIKDFIVFGNKEEGKFESSLILKKDGQLVQTTFKKYEDFIGGKLSQQVGDKLIDTKISLVKIDKTAQTITVAINGKELLVKITADGFKDDHFLNPSYEMDVNGEKLSFKLNNGEACYGFSTHLIFMIFGAYLHGVQL